VVATKEFKKGDFLLVYCGKLNDGIQKTTPTDTRFVFYFVHQGKRLWYV
jgi:hypothetical protein